MTTPAAPAALQKKNVAATTERQAWVVRMVPQPQLAFQRSPMARLYRRCTPCASRCSGRRERVDRRALRVGELRIARGLRVEPGELVAHGAEHGLRVRGTRDLAFAVGEEIAAFLGARRRAAELGDELAERGGAG